MTSPSPAPPVGRILRSLGLPAAPLREPDWPGEVNRVAVAGPAGQQVVVRCQRSDAPGAEVLAEFERERWASDAARAVGIPTPRILAVGHLDGWAYSVQELVTGTLGEHAPDDGPLWRELGRLTHQVSRIDLADAPDGLFSRFGRDLDVAWRQHLEYGLAELAPGDPLVDLGVYRDADRERLREILLSIRAAAGDGVGAASGDGDVAAAGDAAGAAAGDGDGAAVDAPLRQGLLHGDLALRNLLITDDGEVVLIDWGSVRTGPVPLQEVVHLLGMEDWIATAEGRKYEGRGPGEQGIRAFLEGYLDAQADEPEPQEPHSGQGSFRPPAPERVDRLLEQARALQMLETIDLVRWAIDQAPDQVEQRAHVARDLVARVLG